MTSPAAPAAVAAVEVQGVTKRFGASPSASVAVLDGVDLTVGPGEFVSLVGASGCGKTTLLRLLAGLAEPTQGRIRVFGRTPAEACRRREIGVAFQQPALVPSRTALANVRLTLEIVGSPRGGAGPAPADPAELLADFGLGKFLHHYPHQLSGGMRQRVNIACALVHSPRLLLLDEPFGALDELTRAGLMDWLAEILRRTGQTALLVTHNLEEAVCLSDRVAILGRRPGRIAQTVPVTLARPRTEAFRATPGFLRVAADTRAILHRVVRGENDAVGDDPGGASRAGAEEEAETGDRRRRPPEVERLTEPVTRTA